MMTIKELASLSGLLGTLLHT